MRENIGLFKAKRIDNVEWVIGHYIPFGLDVNIHYDIDIIFNREDYIFCSESHQLIGINIKTLCQYTGLSDKHGNKIFENDLVKVGLKIYEIKWNDDNCRFDFWFKDCYQSGCNKETLKNLEVIGNKFDLEVGEC